MPLAHEDIQFIKEHLGEWLAEESMAKPPVVYELELRERSVRVEEELKHQRELMLQGFKQMDHRFEQVDKRFEAMQKQMDKRFEQVDKRFEQVDKRFEQVDKRFESLTARIDRFMIWSFGITVTVGGVVIAAFRYYTQAG